MADWLRANSVDLSGAGATAINDIVDLRTDPSGQGARVIQRLRERSDVSAADKKSLEGLTGDALQVQAARLLAQYGTEKTEAEKLAEAVEMMGGAEVAHLHRAVWVWESTVRHGGDPLHADAIDARATVDFIARHGGVDWEGAFTRLTGAAWALVAAEWPGIAAIAQALDASGKLDGLTARHLWQAARWPAPLRAAEAEKASPDGARTLAALLGPSWPTSDLRQPAHRVLIPARQMGGETPPLRPPGLNLGQARGLKLSRQDRSTTGS